eukprot:jgi/Hompol1/801/HPOL_005446-RA
MNLKLVFGARGQAKSKAPPRHDTTKYKSIQVGEDSYFCRPDAMGVADGIGGWSDVPKANSALYALKLMHYAQLEFEKLADSTSAEYSEDAYSNVDPKEVLQRSYDQTNKDAASEGLMGSTTALIIVLRQNKLRVANLGDSRLMIVRDTKTLVFTNSEQQHSFNFPYQLGTPDPNTPPDKPSDAQSFEITVQEEDTIILASDGLYDNVYDSEIIRTAVRFWRPDSHDGFYLEVTSHALLARALETARDPYASNVPFRHRAQIEGVRTQGGGKLDDVTVIVAVIK